MNLRATNTRVLDPLERFSEIVFGLIMVLTFTCALSVAESGREDVREMLVGAIGCNLAWGIIDAAFYLIACLTAKGRNIALLRRVQSATNPSEARATIASVIPPKIAEAMEEADLDRIHAQLGKVSVPDRPRFTAEDWRGALGVFLLVFASTFPVVIPFFFVHDANLALRISNGIANALLFASGFMLAGYAGLRRVLTGLAMVAIGAALVATAIALGG